MPRDIWKNHEKKLKDWPVEEFKKAYEGSWDTLNKQAFFVLGSEGSGTHMMRNVLIEAGCHWRQEWEDPNIDSLGFYDSPAPLVIRRSLPHAHEWPELDGIHARLDHAEFKTHVIFMVRDFNACARSVVRRDYIRSIDLHYQNQLEAFIRLGEFLYNSAVEFTYVTYEAFCFNPKFRTWLFSQRFGLKYPEGFQIFEGNSQYYGD